ncbi:MAG: hypothetical protein AAB074_01050 [Planctomycetota bacterium]
MRKTMVISSLMLALCSLQVRAQAMEVMDTTMSYMDVGALKGGEWVEMESIMEYGGAKQPATKSKTACVKVDGDHVWIETSAADVVTCYQIAKKDRKIVKAWSGKAGEEGKELTVKPAPAPGATPTPTYEMSGTRKVSKEKLTLGGKEFDCEKIDQETTMKMKGIPDTKSKSTMWFSDGYPFKSYVDKDAKEVKDPTKWEGDKPTYPGGMVKMVSEGTGYSMTQQVSGIGTDAKPSLKMK